MLDGFHTIGGELIFFAAVIGALMAITAGAWKLVRLLKKLADKLDLIDEIPQIKEDLKKIKQEVTTNGGSSLKDAFLKHSEETAKFRRNLSAKLRVIDTRLKQGNIYDSKNSSLD